MWYLIFKLHHPRLTSPPSEQGFSMIEVLVSIMVTAAFLMGTLQAMFINAIFQVRAEREAQATFWIQEDIEKVKATSELSPFDSSYATVANSPPNPSRTHTVMCFTSVGSDAFNNGYGGQLRNYLGTSSTGLSLSGGTTDKNLQIAAEKKLVNKNYRLVRIVEGVDRTFTPPSYTEANKTPHVLRITYKVGEPYNSSDDRDGVSGDQTYDSNGNKVNNSPDLLRDNDRRGFSEIIAQVYTEVIPGGTFKCGS